MRKKVIRNWSVFFIMLLMMCIMNINAYALNYEPKTSDYRLKTNGSFTNLAGNEISWEVWWDSGWITLQIGGNGDLGPNYKNPWDCVKPEEADWPLSPLRSEALNEVGVFGVNEVVIEEGITSLPARFIGSNSIRYISGLCNTITIPDSVVYIDDHALDYTYSALTVQCSRTSYTAARMSELMQIRYGGFHFSFIDDKPVVNTDDTAQPEYSAGENNSNGSYSDPLAGTGWIGENQETVPAEAKKASIHVKTVNKTIRYTKLKKNAQKFSIGAGSDSDGKLTYKKLSGSKRLAVNKNTGKITVKKNTKKGTYRIKIKIAAAKTKLYKASSKTITIKVRVK